MFIPLKRIQTTDWHSIDVLVSFVRIQEFRFGFMLLAVPVRSLAAIHLSGNFVSLRKRAARPSLAGVILQRSRQVGLSPDQSLDYFVDNALGLSFCALSAQIPWNDLRSAFRKFAPAFAA